MSDLTPPIKTKIAQGIFWSVSMRWGMKVIGIVSTMILARLLVPEDFGLIAMSALFIGLLESFSTINAALLLIRSKTNLLLHAYTAWTVEITQTFLLFLLLIIFAPYAAQYFNEPRVTELIYIIALSKFIASFTNIGFVIAQKNLEFELDFRFGMITRLVRFFCVLGFALSLQNYWAVAFGTLLSSIISVAISFKMYAFRPKISFHYFKEYLIFSFSVIPINLARSLSSKFDILLVGGVAPTATTGIYSIASELASIFSRELVAPIGRGLYPNLALLLDNKKEFNRVFINMIHGAYIICIPIGVGLLLVQESLVSVLLGDQWGAINTFIPWLIISGSFASLFALVSEDPLVALGKEKQVNRLMWLRLSVLVSASLSGYYFNGIVGIAMGMCVSSIVLFPIVMAVTSRLVKIPLIQFFTALLKPSLATAFMYMAVSLLPSINSPFLSLLLISSLGIASYALALLLLWLLDGKKEGLESYLVSKLNAKFNSNS